MKNIPDKIYLNIDYSVPDDSDFRDLDFSEVTWSEYRIFTSDISYSRDGSGWIPVSKSLPPLYKKVQVIAQQNGRMEVFFDRRISARCPYPQEDLYGWDWEISDRSHVTHWAPIPELPNTDRP